MQSVFWFIFKHNKNNSVTNYLFKVVWIIEDLVQWNILSILQITQQT